MKLSLHEESGWLKYVAEVEYELSEITNAVGGIDDVINNLVFERYGLVTSELELVTEEVGTLK